MASVVAVSFMVLGSIIFSVTLIIVCGKRKLYQRKECSRRDPHIPGQEANKVLKREIERRIARVSEVKVEPQLIPLEPKKNANSECRPHHFRMKTLDNMKYLESELKSKLIPARSPRENVRSYLMNLTSPGAPLSSCEPRLIHELCDIYDHARHHPSPYDVAEFTRFHSLLVKILHCGRSKRKSEDVFRASRHALQGSSDHDSAIDESDGSGDDDNPLVSGDHPDLDDHMVTFTSRPRSLLTVKDVNSETTL